MNENDMIEKLIELSKSSVFKKERDAYSKELIAKGEEIVLPLANLLKTFKPRSSQHFLPKELIFHVLEQVLLKYPNKINCILDTELEKSPDIQIRYLYMLLNRKLKSKEFIPILNSILETEKKEVIKREAIITLGTIGEYNQKTEELLILEKNIENNPLMEFVTEALGNIGATSMIEEFKKNLSEDTDSGVKFASLKSLIKLANEREKEAFKALLDILAITDFGCILIADNIVKTCTKQKHNDYITILKQHPEIKKEKSWAKWSLDEITTIQNRTPGQQEQIASLLKNLDKIIDEKFGGEIPKYLFDYDFWDNNNDIYQLFEELANLQAYEVLDYIIRFFKTVGDDEGHYAKTKLLEFFLKMKRSSRITVSTIISEISTATTGENSDIYGVSFMHDFPTKAFDVLLEIDEELDTRDEILEILDWIKGTIAFECGRLRFCLKGNNCQEAIIGKKIIQEMGKRKIEDAIPYLVRTLRGSIEILENYSVRALGEIGTDEAIVYLYRVLWRTIIQTYDDELGGLDFYDHYAHDFTNTDNQRLKREAQITLGKMEMKLTGELFKKILLNILDDNTWDFDDSHLGLERVKEAIGDYTIYEKEIVEAAKIAYEKYKDDKRKQFKVIEIINYFPVLAAKSFLLEVKDQSIDERIRNTAAKLISYLDNE